MFQSYHIITYGCQMNTSDSERMSAILECAGLRHVDSPALAEVIIVNACSVRQSAIDRIWGNIRFFEKERAQQHRRFVTILTGCVLPLDQKKFIHRFDAIVPTKEANTLSTVLEHLYKNTTLSSEHPQQSTQDAPMNFLTNEPIVPISQNVVHDTYLNIRPKHTHLFSAYVPIMTGCNAFCTYCAVPYTRGPEVNRAPEEVISEVEELIVKKKYKEITLLGQIINKYLVRADDTCMKFLAWKGAQYGMQLSFLDNPHFQETRLFKFHHLLEVLAQFPGNYWVRFTSSHPNWFHDDLIAVMKKYPALPKHFHLPIQAGHDEVLKRMRRPYRIAGYLDIIQKIRTAIPDATITSDCIVGFCGETDEEFAGTKEVFRIAHYDTVFTAQYSPRPGTVAAKEFPDDVPREVKQQREQELVAILRETARANNEKYYNTNMEVLVFELRKDGQYRGMGYPFKNVYITSPIPLSIGTFVTVRITEAMEWGLRGILAS